MIPARGLLLLLACAWTGCAQPERTERDDGALRAVATCAPAELGATLRAHAEVTLVIAVDCGIEPALAAVADAGRDQSPFLIVVGARPAEGPMPDVCIEAPTGADAAIDLALLACQGAPPTRARYELGARTWTSANRAAGGATTAGPADAIFALLRSQPAGAGESPTTATTVHKVALLTSAQPTASQRTLADDVRAAASRRQNLELFEPASATAAVERGADALLLTTSDPQITAAAKRAARKAADRSAAVIVLDPMLVAANDTCRIGCPPAAVARATAAAVRRLLPEGGDVVFCAPQNAAELTGARITAVANALGFDPVRPR